MDEPYCLQHVILFRINKMTFFVRVNNKQVMNMKIAAVMILGFGLLALSAESQNASPSHETMKRQAIVPIEDNQFSNFYYANEAGWWRDYLKSHEKDENAWLNYYKATRYTNYTEQSREISKNRQAELDRLLAQMKKAIPESFAYNYSAYLNGNKTNDAYTYLDKAYNQNPNSPELWDDMLSKAVIHSDNSDIEKFSRKLSDSGIYNTAEVTYNRNVLSSVEQNGILVTNGNVDTYPVLMMQQLQSYRKDVRIICLEWLANETYSKTVSEWLKLKISEDIQLSDILASSSGKAVYMSLTLPPDDIAKYSANLYCTGLAMKYSKTALDNVPVLVSNWEKLFDKTAIQSTEDINKNYLIPLVLLKQYYKTSSAKKEQQDEVKFYFESVTKGFGLNHVYQKHKD